MSKSVFYSWQSDLPTNVNRNFIRSCLDRAIKTVNKELAITDAEREPLQTEDGVKGIPGTPDVANMIFERIDKCEIFVADISIVGKIPKGRRMPNPNVMIEYGRATKALTDRRILTVFNESFGNWQTDRPFDLQHKLRPITYKLAATHSDEERKIAKDVLTGQLERAIREILGSTSNESIEAAQKPLASKAAKLQAARQFEAQKKAFYESIEGVTAAKATFNELADLVQARAAQIAGEHDHISLRTVFYDGFLVIQGMGPVLVAHWNPRFSNTLNESELKTTIYDGPPRLPGFDHVFNKPRVLNEARFEYTLIKPESQGYVSQGQDETSFSVDELAEHLVATYLDAAEGFQR